MLNNITYIPANNFNSSHSMGSIWYSFYTLKRLCFNCFVEWRPARPRIIFCVGASCGRVCILKRILKQKRDNYLPKQWDVTAYTSVNSFFVMVIVLSCKCLSVKPKLVKLVKWITLYLITLPFQFLSLEWLCTAEELAYWSPYTTIHMTFCSCEPNTVGKIFQFEIYLSKQYGGINNLTVLPRP